MRGQSFGSGGTFFFVETYKSVHYIPIIQTEEASVDLYKNLPILTFESSP